MNDNLSPDIIIFKGKLKSGKTTWAISKALDCSKSGVPTLAINSELSNQIYIDILLSRILDVKHFKDLPNVNKKLLRSAAEYIKHLPLIAAYLPTLDKETLYNVCKEYIEKENVRVVVIDCLSAYNIDLQFINDVIVDELGLSVYATMLIP